MGALVRAHAWSTTELGPIEAWPQSLLTAVDVCLNSRFPMGVFWGPSLITLYNDAYRPSFGTKHPHGWVRQRRRSGPRPGISSAR